MLGTCGLSCSFYIPSPFQNDIGRRWRLVYVFASEESLARARQGAASAGTSSAAGSSPSSRKSAIGALRRLPPYLKKKKKKLRIK